MKRAAMKQAAMTSSLKPRPAFGRRRDARQRQGRQALPARHVHEVQKGKPLSLDAGELRRLCVAADRVDLPADDGARRHEGVDYYQRRRDHQHTCGPSDTVTIISN
jgi:hypothetical protein